MMQDDKSFILFLSWSRSLFCGQKSHFSVHPHILDTIWRLCGLVRPQDTMNLCVKAKQDSWKTYLLHFDSSLQFSRTGFPIVSPIWALPWISASNKHCCLYGPILFTGHCVLDKIVCFLQTPYIAFICYKIWTVQDDKKETKAKLFISRPPHILNIMSTSSFMRLCYAHQAYCSARLHCIWRLHRICVVSSCPIFGSNGKTQVMMSASIWERFSCILIIPATSLQG